MVCEPFITAKPIDIYARVSEISRNEDREPSTEGQVAVCRVRLADLGLEEGKVLIYRPLRMEPRRQARGIGRVDGPGP